MNPSFIILTDFFAVSAQALAYTTSLAAAQQARVVLLHVCHDGLHGPGEKGNLRTEWNKQQKRRELERLVTAQPVPTELIVSEEFFPMPCARPCGRTRASCWCWASPARPSSPWK